MTERLSGEELAAIRERDATMHDGMECPMCGGVGRIFDISEQIEGLMAEEHVGVLVSPEALAEAMRRHYGMDADWITQARGIVSHLG